MNSSNVFIMRPEREKTWSPHLISSMPDDKTSGEELLQSSLGMPGTTDICNDKEAAQWIA